MTKRLLFMGTPDFAVACLDTLMAAGHRPVGVFSQPPRPAGRGKSLMPTPVAAYAEREGLPLFTPTSLRHEEGHRQIVELAPDVIIVVAYGLLLPPRIIDLPSHGCWNIHASLLPRWRGAAPIQRAIEAGDEQTGIDIIRMTEGLDEGPVLLRRHLVIKAEDTALTLHEGLKNLACSALVEALPLIFHENPTLSAQSQDGITYAHKITKAEARLDWTREAGDLARKSRALALSQGVYCFDSNQKRLKIFNAYADYNRADAFPGTVSISADGHLAIACGRGWLIPTDVQPEGGKAMPVTAYLKGRKMDGAFS